MKLTAPADRQFPNGPAYAKGDPVDTDELAAAIGHPDPDALAADLLEQGWPEAKATKTGAKKASGKTDPAPAGDDTAPEGADTKEP